MEDKESEAEDIENEREGIAKEHEGIGGESEDKGILLNKSSSEGKGIGGTWQASEGTSEDASSGSKKSAR